MRGSCGHARPAVSLGAPHPQIRRLLATFTEFDMTASLTRAIVARLLFEGVAMAATTFLAALLVLYGGSGGPSVSNGQAMLGDGRPVYNTLAPGR